MNDNHPLKHADLPEGSEDATSFLNELAPLAGAKSREDVLAIAASIRANRGKINAMLNRAYGYSENRPEHD